MSTRRIAGALAVALMMVGAACDSGDDGATATSAPRETTAPTDPTATTTTTVAATECDFTGDTEEQDAEPAGVPLLIEDVRASADRPGCVEAVTFTFGAPDGDARFGYTVAAAEPPFRDASGRAVDVSGGAFIRVVVLNGTTVDLSGDEADVSFDGDVSTDGLSFIRTVTLVSDFEGTSEWVLGIDEARGFTVEASRSRLVVSVGAPGG